MRFSFPESLFLDFITETYFGMGLKETSWFSLEVGWSGGCFVLVWQLVLLSLHNNLSAASQSFLFLPLYSLHLLLQVFITISSFRAAWYLLDVYYLPTDPDTSQLTAMVVGLVILILLRVTSCLHAGVSSDRPRSTYQFININNSDNNFSDGILVGFHLTSFWYIRNTKEENQKYQEDLELQQQ